MPFEYNRDSDGDDNQLRNDGLGVALLERPHCVFRRGSPFLRDHHDGDERRATFYLRASCTKLELILVCNLGMLRGNQGFHF